MKIILGGCVLLLCLFGYICVSAFRSGNKDKRDYFKYIEDKEQEKFIKDYNSEKKEN